MNMRSRIGILVQAQGASRAATEIGGVAKSVDRVGDKSVAAGRKMKSASAAASGFQRGLRGLGTALKYGAVGVAALGFALGRSAIGQFREAFKASRATANAIKSTGGAANVTAAEVEGLAGSLSLKAGIDDEAIQGAENLLLTFKKVHNEVGAGNDIFNQATKTALDMSAAYGQSLKTSAIQLGKALQDPVAGAAALKRTGAISQSDIDTIKKMAAAHKSLGDQQKYVLDAINKAGVKGRASAIADPFDKAKVAWENFQEAIGTGIAPYLKRALVPITAFVTEITTLFGRKDLDLGEKLRLGFEMAKTRFGPAIKDMGSKALGAIQSAIPKIVDAMASAGPRVAGAFIRGFMQLGPWGKFLAIGFLAKKLGVFSIFGKMAAAKMVAASTPGIAAGLGAAGAAGGGLMGKLGSSAMSAGPWAAAAVVAAGVFAYAFDKDFRGKVNKIIQGAIDAASDAATNQNIGPDVTGPSDLTDRTDGTHHRVPGRGGWEWELNSPTTPIPTGHDNTDRSTTRSVGDREVVLPITLQTDDGRTIATAVRRVALRDLLGGSPA